MFGLGARTFEFRDLAELPRSYVVNAPRMTETAIMWGALKWGLPDEQFRRLDDMPMADIRKRFSEWESDSGIKLTEIVGLMSAIDKHGMEIEYDLIAKGMRLRDIPSRKSNWRDLLVILRMCGPHDRFYRAVNPDSANWDLTNSLLAEVADTLRWLQWAKTESAQDISSMPKPIPRPGVKSAGQSGDNKVRGRKMPLERAKERFDRPDPNRQKKLYDLFRN